MAFHIIPLVLMIFFTSECVPSLIAFLNKISTTSSETAKIRGSRFTHAQQQAGKLVHSSILQIWVVQMVRKNA